ncbi:MAG: hypothetical protein R3C15_01840 [Thermoleophilia bacterium]
MSRLELDVGERPLLALRDALHLRGAVGKDAAIALSLGNALTDEQKHAAHDAVNDALALVHDEHDRNELSALRHAIREDLGAP